MVKRSLILAVFILLLATFGFAQKQTESVSLDNLGWLSGCWEGRQGEAVIEEMWSRPAGGSMLGLSRTVKGDKTISYEFMQFRVENGSLVFLPQPQGGTRVSFPVKDSFGEKFTFENLQHDFPQRIIYEKKGQLLLAAIEGTVKGNTEREEFQMRKVRCNPKDE
ncbi:MAG TPA: DUF6265 family protein [Pyrinomonadaceae bacterium]|nr:DUF6265 family protein [Pyrinomonadaceae bacterium]